MKTSEIIGGAFEELNEMDMINIQGGATPTGTLTSATTTSSVPCGLASAGVSLITVVTATVIYTVAK